jgi:hypothetical protein
MTGLEWVAVIYLTLNVIGGLYYMPSHGFMTTLGTRLFSVAVSLIVLITLLLVGPLTWVGQGLIILFVYNLLVSLYNCAVNPVKWVGLGHVVFDTLLSIALIGLIITVGIVV